MAQLLFGALCLLFGIAAVADKRVPADLLDYNTQTDAYSTQSRLDAQENRNAWTQCDELIKADNDELQWAPARHCFYECCAEMSGWYYVLLCVVGIADVYVMKQLKEFSRICRVFLFCCSFWSFLIIVATTDDLAYNLLEGRDIARLALRGHGNVCLKAATANFWGWLTTRYGILIGIVLSGVAFFAANVGGPCGREESEKGLRLDSADDQDRICGFNRRSALAEELRKECECVPEKQFAGKWCVDRENGDNVEIRMKMLIVVLAMIVNYATLFGVYFRFGEPTRGFISFFCFYWRHAIEEVSHLEEFDKLFSSLEDKQQQRKNQMKNLKYIRWLQADLFVYYRESKEICMLSPAFISALHQQFATQGLLSLYLTASSLAGARINTLPTLLIHCFSLVLNFVACLAILPMREISAYETTLKHSYDPAYDKEKDCNDVKKEEVSVRFINPGDFKRRKKLVNERGRLVGLFRLCEMMTKVMANVLVIRCSSPFIWFVLGTVTSVCLWPVRLKTDHRADFKYLNWIGAYCFFHKHAMTTPTARSFIYPVHSKPLIAFVFLSVMWASMLMTFLLPEIAQVFGFYKSRFWVTDASLWGELSVRTMQNWVNIVMVILGLLSHCGYLILAIFLKEACEEWRRIDTTVLGKWIRKGRKLESPQEIADHQKEFLDPYQDSGPRSMPAVADTEMTAPS